MEQVKIGFLGAGNMGSAIMRGIAGSKLSEQVALYAYDHMPEKTAALAEIGVTACTSEAEIVSSASMYSSPSNRSSLKQPCRSWQTALLKIPSLFRLQQG
jgi:prephenate dehydrogenase